jgi:hypothetical protein
VLSALVKEAECVAQILDAFDIVGWKIAVKCAQFVFESLEPSFDIVALPAAHHNVLQFESPCRPSIPWTTVGGDDGLPFTVA